MSPSIPLPLVDGVLFIDNTSLERFTTCARSAQYALCERRKPANEKSALRFGQILHKVLEARYRSVNAVQTPEVEKVMLAVAEQEFKDWQPPEDDFRTLSAAVSFIHEYGAQYPSEPFTIHTLPDGKPFVEVPFALPLGTVEYQGVAVPVVWTGRIDIAYRIGGSLYLMDHKSTSIMGPSYFKSFELSHQFYGYVWAAERLLGEQIVGVLVNALGVRAPSKVGKPLELKRQLIPVSRGLLTEWKKDCLHLVSDFVAHAMRGYFPKQTAWCNGKFGECPYFKVCTLETDEQRAVMLASGEYKDEDWSPLNER